MVANELQSLKAGEFKPASASIKSNLISTLITRYSQEAPNKNRIALTNGLLLKLKFNFIQPLNTDSDLFTLADNLFPKNYPITITDFDNQSFTNLLKVLQFCLNDNNEHTRQLIKLCCAKINEWQATYGFFEDRIKLSKHTITVVWQDAAIALRLLVIQLLIELLNHHKFDTDAITLTTLWQIALDHFYALCRDSEYCARHNHGVFQNLAVINFADEFAEVPGAASAISIAAKRVMELLDSRITKDGFAKEHTPVYQIFYFFSHSALLQFNLKDAVFKEQLQARVKAIAQATYFFLYNKNILFPLGDTAPNTCIQTTCVKEIKKYANAKSDIHAFADSGYIGLIKNGTRLILNGAFFSRTHKHCDDLHFIWCEQNQIILGEAGMFWDATRLEPDNALRKEGFWYKNPARIFIESAHAHNVVEINKTTWSRCVKPYGVLPLHEKAVAENIYSLSGVWHRPDGFIQTRHLVIRPGLWLLVLDDLIPQNNETNPAKTGFAQTLMRHLKFWQPDSVQTEFSQWFQLMPDAITDAQPENPARFVFKCGKLQIFCSLLNGGNFKLHKGEISPRISGWQAQFKDNEYCLMPAPALEIIKQGQTASFATLFSLDKPCIKAKINSHQGSKKIYLKFSSGHKEEFGI